VPSASVGDTIDHPRSCFYEDVRRASNARQTFNILTNGGDGKFAVSPLSLAPAMSFVNMVVADFNRDGFPDLASQDNGAHGSGADMQIGDGLLSTDLGGGRHGFASKSSDYPTPQTTGMLATGDFDGDGLPDLAFAGYDVVERYGGLPVPAPTNFAMNVYRNTGEGGFQQAGSYASVGGGKVVTGDFNGDGRLDIATDAFGVFFNRGDGTFQDEVMLSVPSDSATCGLATADFDGDGVADLATTTESRDDAGATYALAVLAGSSTGSFAPPVNYPISSPPSVCTLATGDFNGDGKPDIAMVTSIVSPDYTAAIEISIEVFENRGDGRFSRLLPRRADGDGWDDVTGFGVGDFNGDGVTDFAVATQGERDPYADAVNVLLSKCE
jgi:hypothetical protein